MSDLICECSRCPSTREALIRLKNLLGSFEVQLWGNFYSPDNTPENHRLLEVSLEIRCLICHNKLHLLTPDGKMLYDLFMQANAPKQPTEIPF